MIDSLIQSEYADAFGHALTCLIGAASTFAGIDSQHEPGSKHHTPGWYIALGQLNLAARKLWSVVKEYSAFALSMPALDQNETAFQPIVDAALVYGAAFARAFAFDVASDGNDSPEYLAADAEAIGAWSALIGVAREAFGVAV